MRRLNILSMEEKSKVRKRSNYYFYDSERMRFVIGASGLNANLFARWIGLPDGELVHEVLVGREEMTPELARLIHTRLPQIDLGWLMTGRVGGMPAQKAAGNLSPAERGD